MKLGYSRKNPNGAWGYTFLKKSSGIFKFLTLPLEIQGETIHHPWKFCKTKVKNQDPWKFRMGFSWTPLENHFFFNWPLEFPHTPSSIPLEIPCPHPSPPPPHSCILNLTFAVFCCPGATDSVLIFSYLSCFQMVFTSFAMIPLIFVLVFPTWFPCFLQVSP